MTQIDNQLNRPQDEASRLWADMRARWTRGEPVRVEDYLADPRFPQQDSDLILDLVYGEFALREQAGEAPAIAEYVARFPHLGDRVARQFDVHLGLSSASTDLNGPQSAPPAAPNRAASSPDDLPRQIGKYRVVARLGAGGQATVYRAVHPGLGQDVVIKVSHNRVAANAPDGQALATEGRILAELHHANLARVYDLDQDDGRPFIVMEYVPGRSLEQAARQDRLPPREAACMVAAVARAIAHAHARGVVHLDIKPANILLGDDGVPRLIDFGLGRVRPAWSDRPDDTTEVTGTLSYMPPERANGTEGQSLERADVFGLGGVLYFLLTGKAPFRGQTATEIWNHAQSGKWDETLLDDPSIPEPLRRICQRSLAANPLNRYGSADALAADLDRFARGPRLSRRVVIAAGAAAASLIAMGLAVGFWPSTPQESPERERVIPPAPKIHLRVWNGERYRELLHCLPLQTGDEVRIEAERPAGFHAVLLWADPEGVVRELATARPEQEGTGMTYPKAGEAVPLQGRAGTELILFCARRDRPIDADLVKKQLAKVREWPALPGSSVLRMNRDGVTVENTGKGLGQPKQRVDPEGEVADRLRKLLSELREECDVLAAVAVSHQ